jgi:hypothetical protein
MVERSETESLALHSLLIATAMWNSDGGEVRAVIFAAAEALAAGLDSPGLRDLAGRSTHENSFELNALLETTFEELEQDYPAPGVDSTGLLALQYVCLES